jgi:hypothetical protein
VVIRDTVEEAVLADSVGVDSGPHRAAGRRRARPPAGRRDRNRAHAAGGADRPAGQRGRKQPGHRRPAVPRRYAQPRRDL